MRAEVAQRDVGRQRLRDQGAGRPAEKHLAAMRQGRDPRGPVDVVPDHVATDRFDLAGVDAHPDADLRAVGPRLGRHGPLPEDRRADRVMRAAEEHEERIPLGRLLVAVVRAEGRPQELPMPLTDVAVRAGPERQLDAGRALDVGEQARDGAGRGSLVLTHRGGGPGRQ